MESLPYISNPALAGLQLAAGSFNRTSQGPTPEDARKDGHIRGRSKSSMKYPGWNYAWITLSEQVVNRCGSKKMQSPGHPSAGASATPFLFT